MKMTEHEQRAAVIKQTYGKRNPGTTFGKVPERSNGPDCKSGGDAFGGSNPSLPTIFKLQNYEKTVVSLSSAILQ